MVFPVRAEELVERAAAAVLLQAAAIAQAVVEPAAPPVREVSTGKAVGLPPAEYRLEPVRDTQMAAFAGPEPEPVL